MSKVDVPPNQLNYTKAQTFAGSQMAIKYWFSIYETGDGWWCSDHTMEYKRATRRCWNTSIVWTVLWTQSIWSHVLRDIAVLTRSTFFGTIDHHKSTLFTLFNLVCIVFSAYILFIHSFRDNPFENDVQKCVIDWNVNWFYERDASHTSQWYKKGKYRYDMRFFWGLNFENLHRLKRLQLPYDWFFGNSHSSDNYRRSCCWFQ